MNALILERKIGEIWVKMPSQIIGGDANGVYPTIAKRFSGIFISPIKSRLYDFPYNNCRLPNGDEVFFKASISFTNKNLTGLCLGFIMLEDEIYFPDTDYKITSLIVNNESENIKVFDCSFTIENGIVNNYVWSKYEDPSSPVIINEMSFNGSGRSVPVIFGIEETSEFYEGFVYDENTTLIPNYGFGVKWINPLNYISIKNIKFIIEQDSLNEFNLPQDTSGEFDEIITLPSFDELYKKNYTPIKWRIDDIDYPLGGEYRITNHSIKAELVYEKHKYNGIASI